MELSGENDEPAAVTRLIRDGVVVATVKRKFRPGPTPASWLLVRQETDAPGFRDVIDVNRSGNGESAMPLLGLLAPTKRAPLYGDLDEPIACAPPDMSTPEDKCADYKEAWNWAAAAFLLATAEMDVACINPLVATPLGAFACAALTAHWMIALRDLNIAKDRYDACVAFYRANPPTQRFQPGPSVPCDPDPVFVPDVVGAPPSGNAGAGTSRPGPSTCAVYFEYDLATGEIYFYQILYCY
jgi:hypothetical protein